MNEKTNGHELHVVVGAGAIGGGIAEVLTARGHLVRIVTRSGFGPAGIGAELVAADASDAAAMARLTDGAAAIYNCANPPYHRWPELWPPIAASLLGAAERSGGVLVTIANLYAYGPARLSQGTADYDLVHPMTEATPQAATTSEAATIRVAIPSGRMGSFIGRPSRCHYAAPARRRSTRPAAR
jgi:nucleoside-diphosphate-sugar epimerase